MRLMRSPTHEAALEYASRGLHVFPVEVVRPGDPTSGKAPFVQFVPHGKDDATVELETIDRWWSACPDAGVAIACAPSGLVVLDVDIGEGKGGMAALADLEAEGGLTSTRTVVTGSGGLHAYYLADPSLPTFQKIRFRPGLDLIGKGYVVAPPSAHWTGGVYRWSDMREPAPMPAALAQAATRKPATSTTSVTADEPIVEGGRNDAMFRLGCALRDSGIGDDALKAALHFENIRRFTPPLADEEVRRVAESVLRRVQPSRDVALGAVVEAVARDLVPKALTAACWVGDAAALVLPPVKFYATGFEQLDALLGGGICTRQVCGVIGPPSAGKSAWATSVAMHLQKSVPVLHVSTELQRDELMVRFAAASMDFPWRDGIRGLVRRVDMHAAVRDLDIKILGCDDLERHDPIGAIAKEAVAVERERGVMPVVVIDYVQLLARGSDDTLRQKVGDLTMKIRMMSQVLDLAVLAVFSTSRNFYGNKTDALRKSSDPTVYLSAAKESGDIEFDCATILYLDVDKMHAGQPKPARVAVARCRVGDIGFAGARAKLDVGKWWGDPTASEEVEDGGKHSERRHLEMKAEDDARVVELVDKMPGRSWREIQDAGYKVGKERLMDARARLIEAGRLEQAEVTFYDSMHRAQRRTTFRVVGERSPDPGDVVDPKGAAP